MCGGIAAIGGATAVIVRWLSPFKKLKERVDSLENNYRESTQLAKSIQESNDRRFAQDLEALKALDSVSRLTLRAMMGLLDHAVTGNGIEHLQKLKNEIETHLIER